METVCMRPWRFAFPNQGESTEHRAQNRGHPLHFKEDRPEKKGNPERTNTSHPENSYDTTPTASKPAGPWSATTQRLNQHCTAAAPREEPPTLS